MTKIGKRGPGRPALGGSTSVKPAAGHRKRVEAISRKRSARLGYAGTTDVLRLAVVRGLAAFDATSPFADEWPDCDERATTIRMSPAHLRKLDAAAKAIVKATKDAPAPATRGDAIRLILELGLRDLEAEEKQSK